MTIKYPILLSRSILYYFNGLLKLKILSLIQQDHHIAVETQLYNELNNIEPKAATGGRSKRKQPL